MATVSLHTPRHIELTPDMCAELLDPGAWREVLETFARTMSAAVALTNSEGHLLGACHNPQPIWSLAQAARSEPPAGCAFCLSAHLPCTASAQAMRSGEIVIARDGAGLAHVAVPLSLNGKSIGALMAGQLFDRYPEPLPLQRMAREYGIEAQLVWQTAVHQTPVSRSTLRMYGQLLHALGEAFLRQRYSAIVERKLSESNRRFRLLVDSLKEYAVFTVDTTGRVTSWNAGAERLLGYTEAEIVGQPCSLMFTPEDIQNGQPDNDMREAARKGAIEVERWHVRKGGARFLATSLLAGVTHAEGYEFGRIISDITERRESEEALFQGQKLESIGVLAGGVAHDFNNLLQGILVNACSLLEDSAELDPNRKALEDIIAAGSVAAGLTSQLLAYAGKGTCVATRFDLSDLISKMLRLIDSSIRKGVDLQVDLAAGLPWVEADANQIQQVVMNLVINGGEAISPGVGVVRVTTGVASPEAWQDLHPYVYMEVQDSGCGMDVATSSRIFDPFFTTKFLGRGLGLAAVSGIIRRHGGKIQLQSVPGEGSTFRVTLPAAPP
jgi:PAS domain S-box-containing protein